MEDLNLTETETRYFGDLFLCCDEESNGKIPILKATELFRSSNIANDVLKQIMDISVAPNSCASLNHMNRKQFYSSLKLIAAHQSNMALKPELLASPLDLPLPRFTWALNSESSIDLIQLSSSPKEQHITKRERSFEGKVGAYEPIRQSNLSDSDAPQTLSHDNTEALSTDSEIESETLSQRSERSHARRGKSGSPWSTASESPTPTNSVAERPHPVWEHSATGRGVWPINTGEEHTQLLGTEEECSDRHSSDDETERGDVYAISEAQARHYAGQFAQLRPERGLLSGHTARLFFEKSRLSVGDLRKIWLLSDITKDGALSLEEFSIAMHLIVLRRNNMAVPDVLPACLLPKVDSRISRRAVSTDLVDLGADMFSSGTSADFNFAPKTNDVTDGDEKRPSLSPPRAEAPPTVNTNTNKEWTKFGDSPTTSPVNFDFQKSAVERDPKIYHPVALRATPDEEPRVVQRPQPKRDPPPPPPRPLRHHARSSSLDLNRLGTTVAPPPPPRAEYESEGFGYSRDGSHGAFEVVRRSRDSEAEPELKALREQNAVLHRVCRALCAELADVQREKQALRLRLDSTPV